MNDVFVEDYKEYFFSYRLDAVHKKTFKRGRIRWQKQV